MRSLLLKPVHMLQKRRHLYFNPTPSHAALELSTYFNSPSELKWVTGESKLTLEIHEDLLLVGDAGQLMTLILPLVRLTQLYLACTVRQGLHKPPCRITSFYPHHCLTQHWGAKQLAQGCTARGGMGRAVQGPGCAQDQPWRPSFSHRPSWLMKSPVCGWAPRHFLFSVLPGH